MNLTKTNGTSEMDGAKSILYHFIIILRCIVRMVLPIFTLALSSQNDAATMRSSSSRDLDVKYFTGGQLDAPPLNITMKDDCV